MAYEIIPGPRIPDLLFLAQEHRAMHCFYDADSGKNKPLNIRRCDLNFFEYLQDNHYIHPRILHYIRLAGFEGVLQCGFHKVDHALITSLIEVWRPETHTFHLKIGEATITLQDVQVLWGLNVDGPVVSGQEKMNFNILFDLCQTYLGFTSSPESVRGSSIKVSVLFEILKTPLSEEPTEIEFQQRARLYIMILIGGTMFPDLSGSRVSIFYIYNLFDFEQCATLSWGSAVLAYLYRCLSRATNPEVSEAAGPLVLLQLWAWERIRGFRPEIVESPFNIHQQVYGARLVFN